MNKLIELAKTYAPGLATALGGPAAGAVVSAIAAKIGAEDSVKAVTDKLATNPELALKLREIDVRQFEIEVADRKSARERESSIAVSTAPWYSKIVTPLLALATMAAWFAVQWFLLNHTVATEMREIIIRVLGNLDAAFMLVMSYYFGASHKHQ